RQSHGVRVARRPRGGDPRRRLLDLHRAAVASPARDDRARAHQPSRRPSVDHASPRAGGDGSACRGRRIHEDRPAHRRVGHIHCFCRRARRRMIGANVVGVPPIEARPWGRAVAWLVFLAPFFFLTYAAANAVAVSRSHVPSIVFAWERHIPFLGWMIVPYWSIDVFYAASLFICSTRVELARLGRRLVTAQIAAVVCF